MKTRWTLTALLVLSLGLVGACSEADAPRQKTAPSQTAADPNVFQPFTFVHFGDPQMGFGKDGIDADKRRFVAAIRAANKIKPEFVYIAGDLVHKRTREEFVALADAMKVFEVPVKIAPGNHDVTNHETLAIYRAKYGRDYHVFTRRNCDFVAVDSMLLSERPSWFKDKDEKFRSEIEAQWKWLERTLAASKAKGRTHVFLLMHVPPFVKRAGESAQYQNLPPDARKRLLAMAERYGVKTILAGHLHKTCEITAGPITIYVVGGTARVDDKRGFGYRVLRVRKDGFDQEFVPLKLAG
jgi:3',5'-cyclic AMP phosphodiesterase CpdA